jgi:hypothetical protein
VQVAQPLQVVHPTVILVKQQFMEWLLQVAVLLVVVHQLHLLLELWAAQVAVAVLTQQLLALEPQVELVIQAHHPQHHPMLAMAAAGVLVLIALQEV